MITGFNTDIKHNEKVYHIQTEDKGLQNPYIESLVYVGGEILASKKTSYAEQLKTGVDDKWIGSLMEQQHRTMIAAIKRGRFDGPADITKSSMPRPSATLAGEQAAVPASGAPAGTGTPALDDRTLDQVIIDYLASEAESEHLELSLLSSVEFCSGTPVEVRVATKKSLSQQPIAAASIEVKVISTVEAPRVIFRGKTAADGTAIVRTTIPAFKEGTAAVIISAQSPIGNDEVKQLVKRRK
ncbi:MAG TPA: hypothetical protein VG323_13185 [Thermoanaerobaculia bacterium]|nr:hypothetical protein [Thermoanaerobaculia bacterium]